MTEPIKPVGDQVKVNPIKLNDNKELALSKENIATTRLLTIFDVDNFKGYLSPKELEAYATLQEEYFAELKDENGHKVRDVEDIDNGNYLIRDFDEKGNRVRASIVNIETGHEDFSEFEFNDAGEEIGLKHYENNVKTTDMNMEYNENNQPTKITETSLIYDENGKLKGTRTSIRELEYNADGSLKGIKDTNKFEEAADKKLDIKS